MKIINFMGDHPIFCFLLVLIICSFAERVLHIVVGRKKIISRDDEAQI